MSQGILLRSGSFLAGSPGSFDPTSGTYAGKLGAVTVPTVQVAALCYNPVARSLIADVGRQSGLIMRNSDFLAGEFIKSEDETVTLNSLAFGPTSYQTETVSSCVVHSLQTATVRLRDSAAQTGRS